MEVQFNNVTITIGGVESSQEAYTVLCNLLAANEAQVEYTTDTYEVLTEFTTLGARCTAELFPKHP